ncbi:MAG: PepSY-associated TM helix domain-containing protein, partial [Sphingomonas sp.]
MAMLYRTAWRWHFYAGLIVLPVMLWLAVTGGLYLYKPEIERQVYRSWSQVEPSGAIRPVAALIGAAEQGAGGRVTQVARPSAPDESWRVTLQMPDGSKRLGFVDP